MLTTLLFASKIICFENRKKKVREFDGLFIVKQRKNPSKDREKHSITYCVSPYSYFVL